MNIFETNRKGGPYESLKEFMKKSLVSKEYELEWIYGSNPRNILKKSEFIRLLNHLRQNYRFVNESNSLDIRLQFVKLERSGLSNIRCTVDGVQNIKTYCKTNSIVDIPKVTFMKKISNKDDKNPSLTFNQIVNTDYNFRINLKKEIMLEDDDDEVIKFKDNLKDGLKYYRYKKRFSFYTEDNLFRIDLTAVKSNTYNPKRKTYNLAKNLVDSKILLGKEIYEVEVEYVGYTTILGKHPIIEFSKRVYSEWKDTGLSEEEYEAQVALITKVDPSVSFSPEGSQYYVDDDDAGYGFLSDYDSIDPVEPVIQSIETNKPTMDTLWAKAASLRGDPMNLIYMNYWYPDNSWIFWLIKENGKQLLYDGVVENYTADYNDAPENENYVKYTIYPPASANDSIKIAADDKTFRNKLEKGDYNDTIYVPCKYISGLEGRSNYPSEYPDDLDVVDDSPGYESAGSGKGKKPSWAPQTHNSLSKDNRFVDIVNLKLNEVVGDILLTVYNTPMIVSERKCNELLNEYKTMTEQIGERINFVGPQPVSMGLSGLDPDNPHSILSGYVVTEKADGVRAQLFIDKNKQGYLITQKKEIICTGLIFKNVGSAILDGEYITTDRNGKDIKLFMIFDIYYQDNGENSSQPYTYPWIPKKSDLPSRSGILQKFKKSLQVENLKLLSMRDGIYNSKWSKEDPVIDSKDTIRIGYKNYYMGPKSLKRDKNDESKFTNIKEIGKMSRKILDLDKNDNYEYNIDGLIFLPMFYPVKSDNETTVVDNISGTWSQNYKWKPPEENTIDFRLRFVKEEVNGKKHTKITSFTKKGKTVKCYQVEMYVGYDIRKDESTDFTWKILGYDNRKQNEVLFNPPTEKDSIHICNIPLTKDKCICLKDKTEVLDGFIYEMRYEPTNPFGYQWVPLRVRDDKIRPNDSYTANNVWETIQYPVTDELIKGKNTFTKDLLPLREVNEYSYYVGEGDTGADTPLREFHNYIKDKLIRSVTTLSDKSVSILDTSIGRGGDIGKYLRSGDVNFLLGLDISPDVNIAAKKYYLSGGDKPKAMFIQYDTSKSIKGGAGCVGNYTERNKLLLDILYDRQKALPKELRPIVPKFKGLCKKGFDVISSQFSIHYYFSDELTLRTYIQNISENIKKGGYFIGTCYDGMKVFQRFKTGSDPNKIEMIDEFGNRVFSIIKKYDIDDFGYSKDDIGKLFGQQIDVYMSSIGQTITEYLVNFQMFIEIMKEYDLELVRPDVKKEFKGFFDNKDYSYSDGLGGFERILDDLDKLYSKDTSLKRFFPESFQLLKPKNALLRELSGFNNWFIFQKV
jgi:hypothetical protein